MYVEIASCAITKGAYAVSVIVSAACAQETVAVN